MIKPTIGRVVWFYDDDNQAQAYPGIVCYVHNDTLINLTIFDNNGKSQPRTSVFLYQGEGERPIKYFAEWMPYQKGQAAKTEQLEQQLKS
jgi:hypothetical protein